MSHEEDSNPPKTIFPSIGASKRSDNPQLDVDVERSNWQILRKKVNSSKIPYTEITPRTKNLCHNLERVTHKVEDYHRSFIESSETTMPIKLKRGFPRTRKIIGAGDQKDEIVSQEIAFDLTKKLRQISAERSTNTDTMQKAPSDLYERNPSVSDRNIQLSAAIKTSNKNHLKKFSLISDEHTVNEENIRRICPSSKDVTEMLGRLHISCSQDRDLFDMEDQSKPSPMKIIEKSTEKMSRLPKDSRTRLTEASSQVATEPRRQNAFVEMSLRNVDHSIPKAFLSQMYKSDFLRTNCSLYPS